jgi:hypothetical protein
MTAAMHQLVAIIFAIGFNFRSHIGAVFINPMAIFENRLTHDVWPAMLGGSFPQPEIYYDLGKYLKRAETCT